jgi:hypothetical protein
LGRYATLSYFWGSAATATLTQDKLSTFLTHLPEQELPRTFQDAIVVARRLGIRYLWIESLCIMQDSERDWATESSTMDRIYQNGLCNLAATASKDSAGGLFYDRDPRTVGPAVTISKWPDCPPSTYIVANTEMWVKGVSEAVLNTRGWVLQERFMAPRILHFASDQVYWECFELDACEAFPGGFPLTGFHPAPTDRMKDWNFKPGGRDLGPMGQNSPPSQFDGYRIWNKVVEAYSMTNLTKSKDKLIAISALAKEA